MPLPMDSPDSGGFDFTKLLSSASPYLSLLSPVTSLLSGLFGQSPEDQYNEARQANISRVQNVIRTEADVQRAKAKRFADRGMGIARQSGSRRAAQMGYSGDASAFYSPEVSRIGNQETEQLTSIGEQEQVGLAQAEAGNPIMPSYDFPKSTDYISSAFAGIGQFANQQSLYGRQQQSQDKMYELLKSIYGK